MDSAPNICTGQHQASRQTASIKFNTGKHAAAVYEKAILHKWNWALTCCHSEIRF